VDTSLCIHLCISESKDTQGYTGVHGNTRGHHVVGTHKLGFRAGHGFYTFVTYTSNLDLDYQYTKERALADSTLRYIMRYVNENLTLLGFHITSDLRYTAIL
jgi:hypothetical protein